MNPFEVYDFEPIEVKMSDIINLMRKSRGTNVLIRFFYESYVYDAGVRTENSISKFYLDDDLYPSMLGFVSGACIEGVLVSDFKDSVKVLAVNNENPADFFENLL